MRLGAAISIHQSVLLVRRACALESFQHHKHDYFFTFPQDCTQRSIESADGEMSARPNASASEIVFACYQVGSALEFRRGRNAFTALYGKFAQAVEQLDELPPDPNE